MADLLPESTNPTTRIYVRWSDDGQHIRHWSREPFKHGLSEAQPVDAVEVERSPRFTQFGKDPYGWNNDDEDGEDGSGNPGITIVGNAICTWLGLDGGTHTVASIASVFNLPPALVRQAVQDHYWLFLTPDEGAPDDTTFVDVEGE